MAAAVMGDLAEAKKASEEALALHREFGDLWRMGDDVHNLGYVAAESGDWETARSLFEESVRLVRGSGEHDFALWSTRSVGWACRDTGDVERAREIHDTNLHGAREIGNRDVEAATLAVLGSILIDDGHPADSFPYLKQAYRLHRELGWPFDVATDVLWFAGALAEIGRAEDAAELLSLGAALHEEVGTRLPWIERETEKTLLIVREQLEPAAFEAAWERGKRLTPDAAVAKALGPYPSARTSER